MNDKNDINLTDLIKKQLEKVNSLFNEKNIIENEIKNTFSIIGSLMKEEIAFHFEKEIDRYDDEVTTLYASPKNSKSKYIIISYDFDNNSIFPIKIIDYSDNSWLCNNANDVKRALSSMISDDQFMIRLLAISKESNSEKNIDIFDDNIPF
ncbi:hypothetical protein LH23_04485 [Cedecea neteri]|uniref:Uncharacterized protein n=1 Tax=Cedecea neteri TaxID=158822 RepID=A0AAN0VSM2_9ENTR|nr:hypothetical protein [Cedecea neteri]AIR59936.1 hypothetical protein LH23_04485 [Cedecea neteri]